MADRDRAASGDRNMVTGWGSKNTCGAALTGCPSGLYREILAGVDPFTQVLARLEMGNVLA